MLKTSRSETVVQMNEARGGALEVTKQNPYDAEPTVLFVLRRVNTYSSELEIILPSDSAIKVKKAVKETEVKMDAEILTDKDIPF